MKTWMLAQVLRAAATEAAGAVGPRQPGHSDAIAHREPDAVRAQCVDDTDDLVAGHGVMAMWFEIALGQVQVGAAHAAAANADADLAGPGFRGVALHPGQRAGVDRTARVDDPTPHPRSRSQR